MQIVDVRFRDMERDYTLEAHTRRLVAHLEQFCDHIDRCEVTFEHPHKSASKRGGEYSVLIDVTIAPGHELVTRETSPDAKGLELAIHAAFRATERRVKTLVAKQRSDVKRHPHQEVQAFVAKLMDDHGFVEFEGQEIYFHRNSVLHSEFDDLRVGSGVAITWAPGREGPHVTSLRIVDGRGHEPQEQPDES